MPAPSTATRVTSRAREAGRPAAAGLDRVQVEPERRDHVLGDLAAYQVGQVTGLDPQRGVEVDLAAFHRRRQDVVRRRHRGALELLAQVGREGRQHRGERRVGRGAAGDLVALAGPRAGPAAGWPRSSAGQRRAAPRACRPARRRCRSRPRRPGRKPLALQQQLHQGVGYPEHPDRADHAAAAGQQAEGDLGQAELGLRLAPARSGGGRPARSPGRHPGRCRSAPPPPAGEGLQPAQVALDLLGGGEELGRRSRR